MSERLIDLISSEFILEQEPHRLLKEIVKDKSKASKKKKKEEKISNPKYDDQIICFNKRLVDGFIIGLTRSIFYNTVPTDLGKDPEPIHVQKIENLSDKDDIYFLLRVVGYYTKIKEKDPNAHNILANIKRCREKGEKHFKGNWKDGEFPFETLLDSDSIDRDLIEEIRESKLENISSEDDEEVDNT